MPKSYREEGLPSKVREPPSTIHAFGGFTNDSRGLMGGNVRLPVNPCWQFSTDFMYVVADSDAAFSFNDECWNVSFNLVWPPCRGSGGCQNFSRPLLDVANNGSFLTRLR